MVLTSNVGIVLCFEVPYRDVSKNFIEKKIDDQICGFVDISQFYI